jgi:hypothetical protein
VRFIGPLCLCKHDEYVDITTFAMPFRLLFCLRVDCGKYKIEYEGIWPRNT